jgi:hypothetical protein
VTQRSKVNPARRANEEPRTTDGTEFTGMEWTRTRPPRCERSPADDAARLDGSLTWLKKPGNVDNLSLTTACSAIIIVGRREGRATWGDAPANPSPDRRKFFGVRNCASNSRTILEETCLHLGNVSRTGELAFFCCHAVRLNEEVLGASPFLKALRRFGVSPIRIRDERMRGGSQITPGMEVGKPDT